MENSYHVNSRTDKAMADKEIKKIGVLGAGTMGRGIAQVFALYGYPVVLADKTDEVLKNAIERIKERTAPELWGNVASNIETTTDISLMKDRDLVIEAVFEEMSVKKEAFVRLNKICSKEAIIATNTSALSITGLAASVDNPARFIGMHFMNPPKVMKLVEIISGEKTSAGTVEAIKKLTLRIEKVPAFAKDSPGFISNRVLFALIGEALRLLDAGVADKESIDTVMKYGMNHPMGPIELADFIGLDVCRDIMLVIYGGTGDERYRPTAALDGLVKAGKLGRKTKEGFYRYD